MSNFCDHVKLYKKIPSAAYLITGLKKGKTYYVKVRTYKNVKGKKYYSGGFYDLRIVV